MTKNELKQEIVENIRPNGRREITGQKLQKVLLDSVDVLGTESDPVFSASPAANITEQDIIEWGSYAHEIAELQAIYAGLTENDIEVVTNLPASGVANTIYRLAGVSDYSDYMWDGTQWVLLATYNNAIDAVPTAGSHNLVESGGVKSAIDVVADEVFEKQYDQREDDLTSELAINRTAGKGVRWDNGNLYNSGSFSATDYISVAGYYEIQYSRPKTTTPSSALGMAFYDENNQYISGEKALYVAPNPADDYVDSIVAVPSGAAYARFSIHEAGGWSAPYLYGFAVVERQVSRLGRIEDELHKLTLGQMDVVERNKIKSDGTYELDADFGCTDFIPCAGAQSLTYTQVVASSGAGLAFYDENKAFVSYVDSAIGASDMHENTVPVPSGAAYFRATGWNYTNSQLFGEFYAELISDSACYNGKRASNGETTFFSVLYNSAIDDLVTNTFATESQPYTPVCTTGVVLLPPNYTPNGKPCPVIVYFHGWSHYVNYKQWGAAGDDYAGFMMQKQRYAAAGYAVVDVNHKDSAKKGNYSGLGSRQDNECYRAALDYVYKNYNVRHDCYIVCGSAGGINGINATYEWHDVRAAVWLDCWIDVAEHPYPTGCGQYYYGYSGTYDASKVGTCNPMTRIKNIGGLDYLEMPRCPVKFYPLTNAANFMKPFADIVKAGRAAGMFFLRPTSGISHSVLVSGGDGTDPKATVVDNETIRFFEQF